MNCLDVITKSLRRIGVLRAGALPPTQDSADALDMLVGIYRRLITLGSFGTLTDVIPTGDYIAQENQRVIRSTSNVGSITLPDTITDWGVVRPPRDGALVIITDTLTNSTSEYIFDGAAKAWVNLTDLSLTSIAPLADRDPIGLTCYLAAELADEYGQTISDTTRFNAGLFVVGITHNWSNPDTITPGNYF